MRYFIITYGCQMNVSDSERIAMTLEKIGYSPAPKIEKADLIVVNMCSVRQSAVDRVYGNIKNFAKLKKKNKRLKTLLTGCVIAHDFKKFKEKHALNKIEGFDYILPVKGLPHWKDFLKNRKKSGRPSSASLPAGRHGLWKTGVRYLKIKPRYTTKFSAHIPITVGCNNFCSYCVVPYTRGPEISRPAEDILDEVKRLAKKGYKEIWLLGENVNRYRSKSKIKSQKSKIINLARLLRIINKIPGKFWVRFTSSHPKDFSDELIKTIAECEKVTKYISLPVQSGDDKILKKMNRPYNVKEYKNLVKKIRAKIPNVTLSTDVIVGFPGETKKQFQNTIKLFKEIKPDMAYIAQYSPRPGTTAEQMKNSVSRQEKIRRDKTLTEVLKETALENNKKFIGKTVEVLPGYERKDWLIGKTKEYKTIKFRISRSPTSRGKSDFDKLIGKFMKVKVFDAIPWGLSGRLW